MCGSDGRTYNNECLLNRAKCLKRIFIQVAKQGPCESGSNDQDSIEDVSESSKTETIQTSVKSKIFNLTIASK